MLKYAVCGLSREIFTKFEFGSRSKSLGIFVLDDALNLLHMQIFVILCVCSNRYTWKGEAMCCSVTFRF